MGRRAGIVDRKTSFRTRFRVLSFPPTAIVRIHVFFPRMRSGQKSRKGVKLV